MGGCYGPEGILSSNGCKECRQARSLSFCIEECPEMKYNDNGVCKNCHENCLGGCNGPNFSVDSNGCFSCKYVNDESNCLKECPISKYNDTNGYCQPCHNYCNGSCSGPGPTACDSCKTGTYDAVINSRVVGECRLCHENCLLRCNGPENIIGENGCVSCKDVRDGSTCVEECPINKYEESGECNPCHENCLLSCNGPENTVGSNGCDECKYTKDGSFCVTECPSTKYDDNGECKGTYISNRVVTYHGFLFLLLEITSTIIIMFITYIALLNLSLRL